VVRCILPPDTHPVHPRLGQGRALGIPISGLHAVNLVNRWWQFRDTQLSSWVDAAFQALAIDEERSSSGPTLWTSDPRADQHIERVWFAGVHSDVGGAIPTLRWLRSRCCGWPTGRVSADSSSKRMPSQRRLRMPPRRHKTGWPYVDCNRLGTLRQSRTAFYRLLPRLIRRPGAKDPDHEYVANTAVDRHDRGRRYAPAGLIEYLDAGGPVVPVAPARHRAKPAPPPPRRERDQANKPALVQSETSIGGVR
jgi:hypothetical protein